ncbi:BrnT family toxin [Candidatus Deferrimicrobium sp.]|uniref:BrnT family toxin n=1 Tax=Candidatus Deferrimicrobium sp. TaxID=3060586 RepID=UPI002ED8C71A
MDYEWDPKKAALNHKKHEVSFADAVTVFADDRALTFGDSQPDEERHITLGMDALAQVLVVVYTWRGDRVRIISARRATPNERRQYER